jgi:hypothetical protein
VEAMKYYHSGADMPFNFDLIQILKPSCGGACIHDSVHKWMTTMPEDKWPSFVVSFILIDKYDISLTSITHAWSVSSFFSQYQNFLSIQYNARRQLI